MRVLIDECLPRRLAGVFVGIEARTVPEAGWAGKSNGELLTLAESEFDVFVTIDQNLIHQQNLKGRRLAVLVIVAPSNSFDVLAPLVPAMLEAVLKIAPGEILRLGS